MALFNFSILSTLRTAVPPQPERPMVRELPPHIPNIDPPLHIIEIKPREEKPRDKQIAEPAQPPRISIIDKFLQLLFGPEKKQYNIYLFIKNHFYFHLSKKSIFSVIFCRNSSFPLKNLCLIALDSILALISSRLSEIYLT